MDLIKKLDEKINKVIFATQFYINNSKKEVPLHILNRASNITFNHKLIIMVKKIDPSIEIPSYRKHDLESAGIDLICVEKAVIPPKTQVQLSHNLQLFADYRNNPNLYFSLTLRSSATKKGLISNVGIIDQNYQGPLSTTVYNNTDEEIIIKPGDSVSQLIAGFHMRETEFISVDEFPYVTNRGDKGFGSSGRSI